MPAFAQFESTIYTQSFSTFEAFLRLLKQILQQNSWHKLVCNSTNKVSFENLLIDEDEFERIQGF